MGHVTIVNKDIKKQGRIAEDKKYNKSKLPQNILKD
jgi:hypothetical protein